MAEDGAMRHDPVHDRWTLYAPGRANRPLSRAAAGRRARRDLPRRDPDCPLCPGNEDMLPSVLRERAGEGASWSTRIAPNRYPILTPAGGVSEVVIEAPRHDLDLALMSEAEAGAVVETWRDRSRELARRFDWVVVFRNHGTRAGASLVHPHSQLAATAELPPDVARREARAERHLGRTGCCLVCRCIDRERAEGARIVRETAGFLAFVPYAAEVPFELWIAPLRHQSDFAALSDRGLGEFAVLLRDVLAVVAARLGDPDYNLMITGASRGRRRSRALHWIARLRPRTADPGGFEYASGLSVNPSLPERDAEMLGTC